MRSRPQVSWAAGLTLARRDGTRHKFLTGKTKTETAIPQDVKGLRQGLSDYITSQGFDSAISGIPKGGDLGPYMDFFSKQLDPILAQAKESAGNLTGSGFGNILGAAAGRSTSDFLLNLLQQRAQRLTSLIGGLTTAGVSSQTAYQPGFLDYLFQGAQSAAPFLANRGGSGPSFNPKLGGDFSGAGSTFQGPRL